MTASGSTPILMPSVITDSALDICFFLHNKDMVMLRSLVDSFDLGGDRNGIVFLSPGRN